MKAYVSRGRINYGEGYGEGYGAGKEYGLCRGTGKGWSKEPDYGLFSIFVELT